MDQIKNKKSNKPEEEKKDGLTCVSTTASGEQAESSAAVPVKLKTVNTNENEIDPTDPVTEGQLTPSSETESQSIGGNTEDQGPNTSNTTICVPTHVDEKKHNTSNKPNENHIVETSKTCTSPMNTCNRNKTAPPARGITVEQGQLATSKPDKKFQEETDGGDIKRDTIKTSRFTKVIGCWRDEMIVVCLVIVTMVFLLFVCFHYELKIDNMNKEFRTKLDNIRDGFKKQNPGNGINTCLQNDDIQNESNTKIDTIASNVTKMNDTIKNLGDEILTKIQNISTVLNETRSHVLENDKRLTNLNVSLDSFKTDSAQKHDRLNSSVNVLNDTIERNITEKVKSFDDHLEELQNATEKANSIISQLEKDVEKIYPNTFNKGALTAAFVIVIVFVLALYVYVFLYFPTASRVDRTGKTINYNSVLSQIPDNCVLDNSICIVSFDEQRSSIHKGLVTLACQGREIITFVVRSHASLLGLPRCRLYIMCAEFSERHVIIEQPNLGLGDLKRCTHDAVRKIGGELVILYTRDPGSRRLADGQMFNRDIYCVNDQPELSALRDRGRFISLYDSLTPSQNQKLTETVNECLQ